MAVRVCLPLALASLLSACSGTIGGGGGEECVNDSAEPAAGPSVITPTAGDLDVIPAALSMEVSAPVSEAGSHVATQFEIWRVVTTGPGERVWSAEVRDSSALLSATLADGEFDWVAELTELEDWEEYTVRARYQTVDPECSGDCCATWGLWSDDRQFRVTDRSPELFDNTVIRDINIEIAQPSWDAIDAEARPPDCVPFTRDYHVGNVVVDGERFDGVGVRSKGGCGSARHLNGKTAFKVNLSWDDPNVDGCPDTRRHRGLKRLTLNNMVQDSSFTHERIAYHFYGLMGVPVPRVAHVRVSVNGELWGLYLNVESIDRRMLTRNFQSNRGALYEGTYWCDLLPENVPPALEPNYCIQAKFKPNSCSSPKPGDDPLDYGPIRTLAEQIQALPDGGFYPAITNLMDWDTYLSLWAADAVLNHWDGYSFDIINNYRVYHDPIADRWTIIPSGVDQTLGNREVNPFVPQALLANRCLSEPTCEALFIARLTQAADTFEQANLGALATSIAAQIRADVEADPRKERSLQEFDDQQVQLQNFIADRPDEIRAYINNH